MMDESDIKSILSILEKLAPYLPAKAREEVVALCINRMVARDDTFIEAGKRNSEEYILVDGVVRSYLVNREGQEVTISFFQGPGVLSPFLTRTAHHRSILNFQALTACRLAVMDAQLFEKLIEQNLDVRHFANEVLRNELIQKVNKEIRLASWTAMERLVQFRKEYPALENTVSHATIASYLGITNVSLSRLRGQYPG